MVKGMMKHVVEQEDARGGVLDHAFIAERPASTRCWTTCAPNPGR